MQQVKPIESPKMFIKEKTLFFFRLRHAIIKIFLSIRLFYSVRKLFTGLAAAAFIACKLIVANAMNAAIMPASKNTHHEIFIR